MNVIADADNDEFMRKHRGTKVFCDGVELKNVLYADEEQGIAVCFHTRDDGTAASIPFTTEFLYTVSRGKVTIDLLNNGGTNE